MDLSIFRHLNIGDKFRIKIRHDDAHPEPEIYEKIAFGDDDPNTRTENGQLIKTDPTIYVEKVEN